MTVNRNDEGQVDKDNFSKITAFWIARKANQNPCLTVKYLQEDIKQTL